MKPYFEIEPCAGVTRELFENAKGDGFQMARRAPKAMFKTLLGKKFSDSFNTADFKNVYMSISYEEGRVLYQIARSCKPRLIVEFGSSFGISAMFLGAALKDQGFGRMIGTEIEPSKVAAARANLAKAGLSDVVEIREGDALETLKSINEPVGVLFLDGWKDLYLPVTQMLLPKMEAGSALVADNINMFPRELKPFREFLLDSQRGGFVTTTLPVGNSLEFAVKL
ncbi:MAG: class I SAM-dependent methyltransferase [Chloroflexota bacterium]